MFNKQKKTHRGGGLEGGINMYGIDKHGKRIEITARSSLVGRSFHSITIECVDDLKILPRVQGRLMWRCTRKKHPSITFQIKAFSINSFKEQFIGKLKNAFLKTDH